MANLGGQLMYIGIYGGAVVFPHLFLSEENGWTLFQRLTLSGAIVGLVSDPWYLIGLIRTFVAVRFGPKKGAPSHHPGEEVENSLVKIDTLFS